MKIALGADHGGFTLKESIKNFLDGKAEYQVVDFGTYSTESCDYPDYARLVAEGVAGGSFDRAIMVDTTGIASAIVGNKVAGVRATSPTDEFTTRSSREHNNSNMMVIGAQLTGAGRAQQLVELWLKTPFAGGRHQKRLDKITQLENS